MRLHVSPNIFYKEIEKFLVILDLQTEAYYILDPVGTSMWRTLLASDVEAEILRSLQNEYSVERSRLKADLEAFRCRCIKQGFLQEKEPDYQVGIPSCVEIGPQTCLSWRAWWCLFRTLRSLSANGLSRTYQEYARLPIPKENSENVSDLLPRSVAAFARAENFFLMRRAPRDCMPRSLALFRFLRSVGLPVEHCIGVQRFPFYAHAWVEHRGRVVHDNSSRQLMFRTLARIRA